MKNFRFRGVFLTSVTALILISLAGCGAQPGGNLTNSSTANSNSNANRANTNSTNTNSTTSTVVVEAKEPDAYDALVTLTAEAVGDQQKTQMPALSARVSRSGNDRRMEFTMPAGGRVIYLDKGGKSYLILPEMKQYAEMDKESLGVDVRRLLMPEQIVAQVKGVPGMQLVGEEKYAGRDAIKYRYAAVADTQSKAGNVNTESFLIVDKATGLPLHTETTSQSQSGGNVQGYNGIRVVTEIADIKTDVAADQFAEPTGLQKIEADKIKSQVNIIFNSIAMFLSEILKQGQTTASPATSPAR